MGAMTRPLAAQGWLTLAICVAAAGAPITGEGDAERLQFLAESHAAMHKMMAAMDAMPTGDVDANFAAMMIPHHLGAIEMSQALLRTSGDDQLRRLAQEIIVTQQQEIAVMRLALEHRAASPAQAQDAAGAPT